MDRDALTPGGRPVVLVPGLAGGEATWAAVRAELGAAWTTEVVTLPGFDGRPPTTPGLAAHVDTLVERVRRRPGAVLVGHSLGGHLSLAVAAREDVDLAGVVVVDGLPAAGETEGATPHQMQQRGDAYARWLVGLGSDEYAAHMRSQFTAMVTDPSQAEPIVAAAQRSDPATVGRTLADLLRADLRPVLSRVTIPVLAIVSAQPTAAADARYRRQLQTLPRVDIQRWEAVRHFIPVDAPRRLAAALERFAAGIGAPR